MASSAGVTADTQSTRRFKYGLNVAVAVAAAVALVAVINWIGYRQFIRSDWTATRKYSLSDQTRKVLDALDVEHRIVSLLPPPHRVHPEDASIIRQAIDLIDEYDRRSSQVKVEHLAATDITAIERFHESLRSRYDQVLQPLQKSINDGLEAVKTFQKQATELIEPVGSMLEDERLPQGDLRTFTSRVQSVLRNRVSRIERNLRAIRQTLESEMPAYESAKSSLNEMLDDVQSGVFGPSIEQFKRFANDKQTTDPIKDQLLKLIEKFEAVQQDLKTARAGMNEPESVSDYENLRDQLATRESVVIVGPKEVQVIALNDLLRAPDRSQMQPGQVPELRFQGEEKLTGALMGMNMQEQPLIVFVGGGQGPSIGPGGNYQKVAQRLQNINFKVEQWNPTGGQRGPMGRPMPPGPPPEPKQGQKAVWIVLPSPPPDPRNPMAAAGTQQLASSIQRQLDRGDGVMFLRSFNPMPFMGGGDEIAKLYEPWGITAQTDRAVLMQVSGPDRQTFPQPRFDTVQWPDATPITKAIDGMKGHFELPSPLVLGKPQQANTEVFPLIELRSPRMWAATDLATNQQPKFDPSTASNSFVIGAAAQKDDARIIVTTAGHDPRLGYRSWASDATTDLGAIGIPGTADAFGAMWPANAELFVNSIMWLAGLEELIAVSARAQDIRRVNIKPEQIPGLRWTLMAGLPIVTFGAGIGVWRMRRKG